MKVKAVIFDMDGLLIDSEPIWRSAEIRSFSKVGLQLTSEICRQTMGLRIDEVIDFWHDKHPWQGVSKKAVYEDILAEFIEEVVQDAKPMKGVLDTLAFFKEKKLPIGLASSSPMLLIENIVKALDIEHYFDVLRSAEDEPLGKPHPAVYIKAAKDLGIAPYQCLAFEDSFTGMIAALAARMKTVVVPEPENYSSPKFEAAHLKLNSLTEFDKAAFDGLYR
jgi:sugar-phosphatase